MLCTTSRAKKIVGGLSSVALIAGAVNIACLYVAKSGTVARIYAIVFRMLVPATVLVINMMVVREVRRRTSNDAANNLGLQSTLSNSAVPTVLLITTSLVYVLLCGTSSVLYMIDDWTVNNSFSHKDVLHRHNVVAHALSFLVFAYNFYVYLITGKQFRSELHKLFSYPSSPSSSSTANSTVTYKA